MEALVPSGAVGIGCAVQLIDLCVLPARLGIPDGIG